MLEHGYQAVLERVVIACLLVHHAQPVLFGDKLRNHFLTGILPHNVLQSLKLVASGFYLASNSGIGLDLKLSDSFMEVARTRWTFSLLCSLDT